MNLSIAEVRSVASEMRCAHAGLIDHMQREYEIRAEEAEAKLKNFSDHQTTLDTDPREVMWADLRSLSDVDPQLALAKWEQVKQTAREELQNGHLAARAMETDSQDPYDRSHFLVLREELVEEWKPRGSTERVLIERLALSPRRGAQNAQDECRRHGQRQ